MSGSGTASYVVDTPGAPAGLAVWKSAVARAVVPLEVEELAGIAFQGHLAQTVVDDVSVYDIAATPHVVRRTPELISDNDKRYYKLSLQLAGPAILEQDGRRAELRPGDLAIYDTHRPYTLALPEHNQAMVVMFPHELVDLPRDEIARVTAVRFPSDTGLGRVINPFFVELGRNMDQLAGRHASRLVHSALDLLVTMLSQELHRRQDPATNPARSLAREVREYILAHLGDHDLTPSAIAQAHYISIRHLYTIFSAEGQRLSVWIRSRRLEHIRRELADPLLADRPVSWVAARWGLPDAAHFSRLFKAEYGESPTAYRERIVGDAAARIS
ncbi:DNA-binding domain-containing protein, AraC-type [Saccharomonospora marina XMU15]|uniref:DNA-binding domain-containing protein, AraC-type n=1 Tax=Saccharomonospora marina XMU15 TaxID=882083 RepID=H5X3W2_9PSEU|nr:helix-turn-helix domain-containing protein [Saccharomonospora marina]EHR52180.1 DNA-binding domain-containing protein, AraC-type [Saccharomonospora marina XMU15]